MKIIFLSAYVSVDLVKKDKCNIFGASNDIIVISFENHSMIFNKRY